MHVLAIVQNKGGVGKTTVARMIAEYSSKQKGLRVLALDMDPQCNFSRRFLEMEIDTADTEGVIPPAHEDYDPKEDINWNGRSSTADIFGIADLEEKALPNELPGVFPYLTSIENLEILPGHASKLLRAERVHEDEMEEMIINRLKEFLDIPEVKESYDLVIIDTPPSKGPLTVAAVRASSHILIPTVLEPQSLEGLFGMMQLWMRENRRRESNNPIELLGILPNMYRHTRIHNDFLKELSTDDAFSPFLVPHKLHKLIAFVEADAEPPSVFERKSTDEAKKQAQKVCEYIYKRMNHVN